DPIETRVGGGGTKIEASIFKGRLSLPFINGTAVRPDECEIKLGNFYIDLQAVTAAAIVSDNVDRSEVNTRTDSLVSIRADIAALLILGNSLQLSIQGTILYLPFKNQAGVSLTDPARSWEFRPITHGQVSYDFSVGNWDF